MWMTSHKAAVSASWWARGRGGEPNCGQHGRQGRWVGRARKKDAVDASGPSAGIATGQRN